MQLYERIEGNRVTYRPYQPSIDDRDITEAQVVTLAGALGVTMLTNYANLVPPHKRIARKIKAVEDAVLDLFRGTGQNIDTDMVEYAINCWNLAAMNMARGAKRP